jgi:hypothetical protein
VLIFHNLTLPNASGHFELSFEISLLNHAWIRTSVGTVRPYGLTTMLNGCLIPFGRGLLRESETYPQC